MGNKDMDKLINELVDKKVQDIIDKTITPIQREQEFQLEKFKASTDEVLQVLQHLKEATNENQENVVKRNPNQLNMFDLKVDYAPQGSDYDFVVTDTYGDKHMVEVKKKPVYAVHGRNNPISEIILLNSDDINIEYKIENNLKELIKRCPYNQEEIAGMLGISSKTLSNILNNKYSTSLEVALKISYLFNIPVNDIFKLVPSEETRQE